MAKHLVVVESPAKAKTIKKYLGPEYEVLASYGHVRDLRPKEGAVEPDNDFAMHYEPIERNEKHVAALTRAMKKAEALYLATDPDRQEIEYLISSPSWMRWDSTLKQLRGTAGWNNIRPAPVEIRATDGIDTTLQAFTVDVRLGEIDCNARFPAQATSPYILPYRAGKTYELWVDHCPPPPFTNHQNWFAWDFRMAMGDTILAARAGTVTAVVEHYPDGTRVSGEENLIYIRHVDGTNGFYVHFMQNGVLVNVGDVVAQGEPVGLAGDSGGSAGPHLHFVVFRVGGFTRQYSMPVSFANASGPLDGNGAMVLGADYTALP